MNDMEDDGLGYELDDPIANLQSIAATMVMKLVNERVGQLRSLTADVPHLDHALDRVLLELNTTLTVKPEGDRLWGPVNTPMLVQEALKDQADATDKPQLYRTMTAQAFRTLVRNKRKPNHGFHGRSLEGTITETGMVSVYVLPLDPSVDPVANDLVD